MPPKPLVAGNWKMNGRRASLAEIEALRVRIAEGAAGEAEIVVCPPATLIMGAAVIAQGAVGIGGQDCDSRGDGAHTGDINAAMLADAGAAYVILGHSERRQDHGETNAIVREKVASAWAAGLTAIVCVGETREERSGGQTLDVVGWQVKDSVPDGATAENLVIAYEPIWAIGTGLTPSPEDVRQVHALLREGLRERMGPAGDGVRLLYGGSVKPDNAAELLRVENVDGALVGGASLKAADFLAIAEVYR